MVQTQSKMEQISLNFPLIYLSLTYSVSCYFTSGLEAPLINLVATIYASAVLWPRSILLQILVGLSPLIRPELIVPCAIFVVYAFVVKRQKPLFAIVSSISCLSAYGLFRIWYYADLFPNTFYLKDTIWFIQGLKYLYDTLIPNQTIPYLLVILIIFLILRKTYSARSLLFLERSILGLLSLSVGIYVVKIGGDPRHFRYLAFPFILAILSTGGFIELITQKWKPVLRPYLYAAVFVFGLVILCNYPRQLMLHPLVESIPYYKNRPSYGNHRRLSLINDAEVHRQNPGNVTPKSLFGGDILDFDAAKLRYANEIQATKTTEITQFNELGWGFPLRNLAQNQKNATPLYIMADYWCQNSYLHPALSSIHSLGLTEPFLARIQMPAERPAHKLGLIILANDLLSIRSQYGFGRNAFEMALNNNPETPAWIAHNIDILRKIEQKVYNDHDLYSNIKLAFTRIPKFGISSTAQKE